MKTLTGYIKKERKINEDIDLVPWVDGYKDATNPATLKAFKEAVLKLLADDVFDNKKIMQRVEDWLKKQGYISPLGNCNPTERAMNVVLPYVAAFVNALKEDLPFVAAAKIDKTIRDIAPKVCKSCRGVKM